MFLIYGDESSDARNERVLVVAALLGDSVQWTRLKQAWQVRTAGVCFHAADCDSGYGDYREIDSTERAKLSFDLATVLAESGVVGFGIGIDVAGCRRAFPDILPDQTYYSAFLRTVDFLIDRAKRANAADRVQIVFDRRKQTQHNCGLLHTYTVDEYQSRGSSSALHGIDFVSRDEIGIQAADLWARELMKYFSGRLSSDEFVARPNCQALLATGRFGGDLQCAEYFEDLKMKMPLLQAQTGMDRDSYIAWLKKKRRQDNQSNRITYMMEVASADRNEKL